MSCAQNIAHVAFISVCYYRGKAKLAKINETGTKVGLQYQHHPHNEIRDKHACSKGWPLVLPIPFETPPQHEGPVFEEEHACYKGATGIQNPQPVMQRGS